jgi:uncharacterized membrane protein YfcA
MEIGLLMLLGGLAAGLFGSLLGLGGGLLIVPLLSIGFGLPLREAVGVSLVCVIVTSSASAGVFLQRRQADLRLGMTLELFTAMGAIAGGLVAFLLSERVLAGLFAALLVYVAVTMARSRSRDAAADEERPVGAPYQRMPAAIAGSVVAGVFSALLGVGGGTVKVPVMHLILGIPLRIATATSNLMIGITASASAFVYLLRGGIDVHALGPTAVGVFIGATIGSRFGGRVHIGILRLLFVGVLLFTAFEMARRALAI